jgi:sugar lactone lactonase YvrE
MLNHHNAVGLAGSPRYDRSRWVRALGLWLGTWLLATTLASGEAYRWTTIAGSVNDAGSVDGVGGVARFYRPNGVAIDDDGTLLLTDAGNSTLRKLERSGDGWLVTTVAGVPLQNGAVDGTGSVARFEHPFGIAVNSQYGVLVADDYNSTIRRIARQGTEWVVTTIAGLAHEGGMTDGTNAEVRFVNPLGLALDRGGRAFVVDGASHTIRLVIPVGTNWVATTIAGTPGWEGGRDGTNGGALFHLPKHIAVDGSGNAYVADYMNHTIRRITRVGTNWVTTTIAGQASTPGFADGTNNQARFFKPFGMATDVDGNVYVSETENCTIRKMKRLGTNWVVTTIGGQAGQVGTNDGTNNQARFSFLGGLAVDKTGNVFVADRYNNTIRMGVPVPEIRSVDVTNAAVSLDWSAVAGQTHQLQYSSNLVFANWLDLGLPLTASNSSLSASDLLGPDPQRFYRVKVEP